MATIEEVVQALTKQTEDGALKWNAFTWADNGVPQGWQTTTPDRCSFFLIDTPPQLSISKAGRLINIGEGEHVQELGKLIGSISGDRRMNRDEALAYALECLQS